MPTISVFFGILIRMFYDDHNPPHFHAYYNEFHAIIDMENLEIMDGSLPSRALNPPAPAPDPSAPRCYAPFVL